MKLQLVSDLLAHYLLDMKNYLLSLTLLLALQGCGDETNPGANDSASQAACASIAGSGSVVQASRDASSAGSAVVPAATLTLVSLPEGAEAGFVTYNIPEPHFDHAVFVTPGVNVTSGDLGFGAGVPAGACAEDLVDFRAHAHEEGNVVIELSGTRTFMIYPVAIASDHSSSMDGGHDDGGHDDGGHDDGGHDDGHHDHDH